MSDEGFVLPEEVKFLRLKYEIDFPRVLDTFMVPADIDYLGGGMSINGCIQIDMTLSQYVEIKQTYNGKEVAGAENIRPDEWFVCEVNIVGRPL